ncbi:MAG: serine O-acetyltransferase [Thermoanaerobaculia bacterium]
MSLLTSMAADFGFFRKCCDGRADVALFSYGLYPVLVYRFGRAVSGIRSSAVRWPLLFLYHLLRVPTELLFGISLARTAEIGIPLMIHHHGQIFVASGCRIGARCQVFQGVTIGESGGRRAGRPAIGDDVIIGAGAKVLGPVEIGSGARIGANAVVVDNVPAGTTVVGIPARPAGEVT